MKLDERLVDPADYGPYRLSNLPGTILAALTPEKVPAALPDDVLSGMAGKYDKVVLLMLDGFGWGQFTRCRPGIDALRRLEESGKAMRLATQFPSTTACNVTTMNTALDVAQHGVYEWLYYEPAIGGIIAPMLYSYGKRVHERDTLKGIAGLKPADIYPAQSIYRMLEHLDVSCYAFQDMAYAISTYTDAVFDGAKRRGFLTLSDGLVNLAEAVIDEPGKAYYYFYYDKLDSLSHAYGPAAKEVGAETDTFFTAFERLFLGPVKEKADKVLFIVTADHGQVAIDPSRCVYLNIAFPEIEMFLRRSPAGVPIVPAGSCRDMFLYVRDGMLDDAQRFLSERLRNRAVVVKARELVENGYFGAPYVSEAMARRLGDLVILPFAGECVWWYEEGLFKVDFLGHHGGLTKEEMEIPLLLWEI